MKKLLALGLGLVALSQMAFGAITLPAFDYTDFNAIAGLILGALAVVWLVKRGLGLLR